MSNKISDINSAFSMLVASVAFTCSVAITFKIGD